MSVFLLGSFVGTSDSQADMGTLHLISHDSHTHTRTHTRTHTHTRVPSKHLDPDYMENLLYEKYLFV